MKGSIDEYNAAVDKGNEAWKTWREVYIYLIHLLSIGWCITLPHILVTS